MTGAARTAGFARRSTSKRRGASRSTSGFAAATRDLLHRTVLEAVDRSVRAQGWAATTMADVAAAAGVSRQTLYNEFGSRQALLEAYLRREVDCLLVSVEQAVRSRAGDARAALEAAFGIFLELARDEPLIRAIVADAEGGELVQLLTSLGRALAVDRVGALIAEVWPRVSGQDAALLTDAMVRLAISHALVPVADPGRIAHEVVRLVGPFVDEAIGRQ
ncbi:MAG: TetR/AcrR family transcriptional regulator [Jatrophihabitans sp.]|nr:MAG: TetR/AcrR family transcriptional regulator [Jatrophihabitans sp.]